MFLFLSSFPSLKNLIFLLVGFLCLPLQVHSLLSSAPFCALRGRRWGGGWRREFPFYLATLFLSLGWPSPWRVTFMGSGDSIFKTLRPLSSLEVVVVPTFHQSLWFSSHFSAIDPSLNVFQLNTCRMLFISCWRGDRNNLYPINLFKNVKRFWFFAL